MAVLVTGGAGYIGSVLTRVLVDRGESVVVADDLSTGFAEALPPTNVTFLRVDVCDGEALSRALKNCGVAIQSVIHLASKTIVGESIRDPVLYYRSIVGGACGVLRAAQDLRVREIVFSSTAAVYGNPSHSPVSEDAELNPLSPYGSAKLAAEKLCASWAEANSARLTILRYFNVAGADPEMRTGQRTKDATHLIKVAAEVAGGKRSELNIFGVDYPTPDGSCIRDFVHVTDLALAHLAAMTAERATATSGAAAANTRIYNVGYGTGASVWDVVRTMARVSGREIPTRIVGRRNGDPVAVVADARRIRSELGWAPQHASLEEICRTAYEWERRLAGR